MRHKYSKFTLIQLPLLSGQFLGCNGGVSLSSIISFFAKQFPIINLSNISKLFSSLLSKSSTNMQLEIEVLEIYLTGTIL